MLLTSLFGSLYFAELACLFINNESAFAEKSKIN